MDFKFAFFFLLGLSFAFAAPGRGDSHKSEDNNPLSNIPFLGKALGGGGGGGGKKDNGPLSGLSKIPFIGGFANALQEGMNGGKEVLKKGVDTGKAAAQTGMRMASGFLPLKLPF